MRKRALGPPPADGEEPAVDTVHWGFAGTRLLTGRAALRVVYTGGETLYGEIVRSAIGGAGGATPLQAALGRLVWILLAAAALVCLALALVRLHQGFGWIDALVSALTLAVAALPEEFPIVFTFFLGVGVYRLAKRQALVRRAVSVENIGRVSCICSDKTGTITEGRLRLAHLEPAAAGGEARLLARGGRRVARGERRPARRRDPRRGHAGGHGHRVERARDVPLHRGSPARDRDRAGCHGCALRQR